MTVTAEFGLRKEKIMAEKLEANHERVGGWSIDFIPVHDKLPNKVKPLMRLQNMY